MQICYQEALYAGQYISGFVQLVFAVCNTSHLFNKTHFSVLCPSLPHRFHVQACPVTYQQHNTVWKFNKKTLHSLLSLLVKYSIRAKTDPYHDKNNLNKVSNYFFLCSISIRKLFPSGSEGQKKKLI